MNLVCAIGKREVFSWKEVQGLTGLARTQLQWLVRTNRLFKRHCGMFPFALKDLNQFLVRLNAGEIEIGVRGYAANSPARAKQSIPSNEQA